MLCIYSLRRALYVVLVVLLGCGGSERGIGAGGGGDGTGAMETGDAGTGGSPRMRDCPGIVPEGTPARCTDGVDNDCDGRYDCNDTDCSGVGDCPVCGMVETPLSSPLALPDGVGGVSCNVDGNCPSGQRCFDIPDGSNPRECRESYVSALDFVGFGQATLESVDEIRSVCVVMEHSWARDLEIDLKSPDGREVRLQAFQGQTGGEVYLGNANDCDDEVPVPGEGAMYCWTPQATNASMLEFANNGGPFGTAADCDGGFPVDSMPSGDYSASSPWADLIGAPLNGVWELSITDLWPIDNGYVFEWSITFDAGVVADCSTPLI